MSKKYEVWLKYNYTDIQGHLNVKEVEKQEFIFAFEVNQHSKDVYKMGIDLQAKFLNTIREYQNKKIYSNCRVVIYELKTETDAKSILDAMDKSLIEELQKGLQK